LDVIQLATSSRHMANAVGEAGRLCGQTAAVDLGVVCTEVVACNEVK
jgi:hypothetical protein